MALLTEVTNEAIALVDPNQSIDRHREPGTSAIASTFFVAVVITSWSRNASPNPRLGPYTGGPQVEEVKDEEVRSGRAERSAVSRSIGTRCSRRSASPCSRCCPTPRCAIPVTGDIFGNSPFMDSLIFIIMLLFLVAGICYGVGARTFTKSVDVINAIVKTFSGLAGTRCFLLLLIAQFIAYFNFSNMPVVVAVKMADFARVGRHRPTVAADRLHPRDRAARPDHSRRRCRNGRSSLRSSSRCSRGSASHRRPCSRPTAWATRPTNVITPLMVYLPFIVLVAQRYYKDAGIGTIIAMMIPYTLIVLVTWLVLFVAWYLIGIPFGPGYPVHN